MTVARKYKIKEGAPGFFHCYSRCTQQQFLCGRDSATGEDYSHRREWIVERIKLAALVFAVDIYAYAVLENHFHIVFYVDPDRAFGWSDEEVVARWHQVYEWQRALPHTTPPPASKVSKKDLDEQRKRLGSVSWMMKAIKEPISRRANAEKNKKGNFWDGRFGSTALVDDSAVVTGMAYVDLNVIRAAMAESLQGSDFTSIQLRLNDLEWVSEQSKDTESSDTNKEKHQIHKSCVNPHQPLRPLFKLTTSECASNVAVSMDEYLTLLHYKLDPENPYSEVARQTVTQKLGCDPTTWNDVVDSFDVLFNVAAGAPGPVESYFNELGRTKVIDRTASKLFKKPSDPS